MQNIEEIYKEYSTSVYKYLFCLTQNKEISEDLTQETFALAVKDIKKFRGECKLSVWLCQIAKHLWYKELKKKNKNINVSFEEINENALYDEMLEENLCAKEEKLKLFKDMQKLDEKSREVMYLRMVGNLSYEEIGEILGKTSNWARVTFYRAKQKIREENENEK
ncbi:MAG: sigma-70 family RNA polymerase sigma factor [Clostridia bacterium]|nr:sigma-70 family RNA polymerase sigma factor [Clostridia bacterium]